MIASAAQEAKQMFDSLSKQFTEQQRKLQEDIMSSALVELRESVRVLFDTHPDLQSFAWDQGTYYNDEYYIYHAGIEDDELWINDRSMRDAEYIDTRLFEQYEHLRFAVSQFLNDLGEDNLKVLFGLGNRIVVTRDGISIEEGHYEDEPEDRPTWY